MTPMSTLVWLTVALAALPVHAAPAPVASTRTVSAQESAAFAQFYQRDYPAAAPATPAFLVTRAHGKRNWDVSASVDGPAQRSSTALCRMARQHFVYDARAPKEQRWSATPETQQFVWRSGGPACVAPTAPVLLTQALGDAEITPLLQQQGALLASARLLMGGNTDCAWQRNLPFTLAAIDVAPVVVGKPVLRGLRFESDHASSATVWVRKTGNDLTAWSTTCVKPHDAQKSSEAQKPF